MFRKQVPLSNEKVWSEISRKVNESYPNACIIFIDECISEEVKTRYVNDKEKRGSSIEIMVWHGTKKHLIDKICEEGFDPKYNTRSAYGKGVYFSSDLKISLSEEYAEKDKGELNNVFLCKIIKNNNEKGPHIFVVPTIEQSMPLYVIGFYKS